MTTYGSLICANTTGLANCFSTLGEGCVWYYDGIRVMYQIADYTGQASYETCAENIRNEYVPRTGSCGTPARRTYLDGVARHWQETGAAADVTLAQNCLVNNGAIVWTGGAGDFLYVRDYAMSLRACLASEFVKATNGTNPFNTPCANRDAIKNILVDYLTVWNNSTPPYTGSASTTPCTSALGCHPPYVKPFFSGLVMEALIKYDYWIPTASVRTAVLNHLTWLHDTSGLWVDADDTFVYTDGDSDEGTVAASDYPVLNLLIAPAYAWGWRQNGSALFLNVGDRLFAKGVSDAFDSCTPNGTVCGKQFSQNYRWSFDFVSWRQGGALYP